MGMSVQPSGSKRGTTTTLAEINVTPLVDVMLVLLIIFMISAPLMQSGVSVDLPKTSAATLTEPKDPILIVLNKSREITIGKAPIDKGTLRAKLEAIAAARPDAEVFLQADQSVPYGFVAQVMAEVKRAKINRVGLVTEPGESRL